MDWVDHFGLGVVFGIFLMLAMEVFVSWLFAGSMEPIEADWPNQAELMDQASELDVRA